MSLDNVVSRLSEQDIEGGVEELCSALKLPRYPMKEASQIRVDFLFSCVALAADTVQLKGPKLQLFLQMCVETYDKLCGTGDGGESVEQTFDGFRDKMVAAVVGGDSDDRRNEFSLQEARLLSKMVINSLFRFHKAYKLCSSDEFQDSLLVTTNARTLDVELPLQPSPLDLFQDSRPAVEPIGEHSEDGLQEADTAEGAAQA
eukprot:scaffold330_cov246-Pinguiococcus_pyrenoidosus.AAC.11